MRPLLRKLATSAVTLAVVGMTSATVLADDVEMTVRANEPGDNISRYIYGSFAEHLGRGIYEGIWVGEDSPIPNTNGFRDDVVGALKKLKMPVLRWPGGRTHTAVSRWQDFYHLCGQRVLGTQLQTRHADLPGRQPTQG